MVAREDHQWGRHNLNILQARSTGTHARENSQHALIDVASQEILFASFYARSSQTIVVYQAKRKGCGLGTRLRPRLHQDDFKQKHRHLSPFRPLVYTHSMSENSPENGDLKWRLGKRRQEKRTCKHQTTDAHF